MLSRSQRLNSREFAVAFEKGRVLRHPLLQLRIYRRESQELLENEKQQAKGRETGNRVARAAFVVPKKLGKATWRNRVRRRVRERYRLLHSGKEWKSGLQNCDLIFFINAQSETATAAQIDDALAQLIKRAQKVADS